MKLKLNVYKRKIYIPKDIVDFPFRGEVDALVGAGSILIIYNPNLVDKDLKYFTEVINSVRSQ